MHNLYNKLSPEMFLKCAGSTPVLDVRSPKEYRQGHIPGAFSLPLFSDEERAVVGTTYTHQGKDAAILKGLEIVGPRLDYFVRTALEAAPGKEVLVHCWRGGMRSEAMAWLLQFAGFKCSVLEGGYKAYRKYSREMIEKGLRFIVLGGMTGSGKTEVLHWLREQGEQILDLEALARHKGSAFGTLGQGDQPSQEQFENDLAARWMVLDSQKPVWIEDESRNIGKVIIPETLYDEMGKSTVVFLDVPFGDRVKRLAAEYGGFEKQELAALISKISRRIGADLANSALNALDEGDIEKAISIVLQYYDKTYLYGLSKRISSQIVKISYTEFRRVFTEIRREIEIRNPESGIRNPELV
jgi:tRNA 2-selenouridine synthase